MSLECPDPEVSLERLASGVPNPRVSIPREGGDVRSKIVCLMREFASGHVACLGLDLAASAGRQALFDSWRPGLMITWICAQCALEGIPDTFEYADLAFVATWRFLLRSARESHHIVLAHHVSPMEMKQVFFVLEVGLRLWVHRLYFFVNENAMWLLGTSSMSPRLKPLISI